MIRVVSIQLQVLLRAVVAGGRISRYQLYPSAPNAYLKLKSPYGMGPPVSRFLNLLSLTKQVYIASVTPNMNILGQIGNLRQLRGTLQPTERFVSEALVTNEQLRQAYEFWNPIMSHTQRGSAPDPLVKPSMYTWILVMDVGLGFVQLLVAKDMFWFKLVLRFGRTFKIANLK